MSMTEPTWTDDERALTVAAIAQHQSWLATVDGDGLSWEELGDGTQDELKAAMAAARDAAGWSRQSAAQARNAAQFYPVGEIENLLQIAAELRIAGQRMEIQASVMKDWSERFYAFEAAIRTLKSHDGGSAGLAPLTAGSTSSDSKGASPNGRSQLSPDLQDLADRIKHPEVHENNGNYRHSRRIKFKCTEEEQELIVHLLCIAPQPTTMEAPTQPDMRGAVYGVTQKIPGVDVTDDYKTRAFAAQEWDQTSPERRIAELLCYQSCRVAICKDSETCRTSYPAPGYSGFESYLAEARTILASCLAPAVAATEKRASACDILFGVLKGLRATASEPDASLRGSASWIAAALTAGGYDLSAPSDTAPLAELRAVADLVAEALRRVSVKSHIRWTRCDACNGQWEGTTPEHHRGGCALAAYEAMKDKP